MRKLSSTLLCIVCLISLMGCYDHHGRERLERAEAICELYPDSAADILDSILLPEKMGKKYYMRYLITHVQANYKAYHEIKNDTAIFEAVRYYSEKPNEYALNALSNYSAAVVRIEQGNYMQAMDYLMQAQIYAPKTHEYKLQGLIHDNMGYLYDLQLSPKEAIRYYKQAANFYCKGGNIEPLTNSFNTIADCHLALNQPDSALYYYTKAERMAKDINKIGLLTTAILNKSVLLQGMENYPAAIAELRKLAYLPLDSTLTGKYYLNLAESYLLLNKTDSARFYADRLIHTVSASEDLYFNASVYFFLSEFEKERKNYKKAMEYMQLYIDNALKILEKNQSLTLIEAEKRFNHTYYRSQAEQATMQIRFLILGFTLILLIVGLLSLLWRQKQKQKKLQTEHEKQLIIHTQQQKELENKLLRARVNHFTYTNSMQQKILEKVTALHAVIQQEAQAGVFHEKSERAANIEKHIKETQKLVRDDLGLTSKLFLTDNLLLTDGIVQQLSADDVTLICMLYCRQERKDIANIFSITLQALYNRIPRLKNKLKDLGISDKQFAELFGNSNE